MFKKIFHIHVELLWKLFFFLPIQLKYLFSNVIGGLLYLIEILLLLSALLLGSLYVYLGTSHATQTITKIIQETLTLVEKNSDYKINLGLLSLEKGILIEDLVIEDLEGVWLEFGKIYVDIELPDLAYAFTKLTIDNIIVEDASYYRLPNPNKPVERTPLGVEGMLIPKGVLPFPLGEIEISSLSLRNVFVGAEGMNLEDFDINLYANVEADALIQRDLATFNVKLIEEGTTVEGIVEYRSHEFFLDVDIVDTKWAEEFPKLERIEGDVSGFVRASEFPPSPERPLVVDLEGSLDIDGIFWANKKDMSADVGFRFTYDRTYVAAENATFKDGNIEIFVPYFAANTWTFEYVASRAEVTIQDINTIVPAMYGSFEGDVSFAGNFREMALNFDFFSPKIHFGSTDFELFSLHNSHAEATTIIDILELNQDIKWAGIATAQAKFHAEELSLLGEKVETEVDATSQIILDRYHFYFQDSQIDILDASASSKELVWEYDYWVSDTFPKLEGIVDFSVKSLNFLESNFPITGKAAGSVELKGKEKQVMTLNADIDNYRMPGLMIDSVNINADITNTDLIIEGLVPNIEGKVTTSYLDLYDININTVENMAYNKVEFDLNYADFVMEMKAQTFGNLIGTSSFTYYPLESEIHVNSLVANYTELAFGVQLTNKVKVNFANYFQVSPLEVNLAGKGLRGQIKGEASFNENNFKLSSYINMPLEMLQPYLDLDTGRLELDLDFAGDYINPSGNLALAISHYIHLDQIYNLNLEGVLNNSTLDWNMIFGQENEPVTAQGLLPLQFNPYPSLNKNERIRAQAKWEGDIGLLWNLIPPSGRELYGRGMFNINVLGTYDAPLVTGKAFLANGRFIDNLLSYEISDINTEVNLRDSNIDIKLQARDGSVATKENAGKGILLLNGTANMKGNDFELDIRSALNSFAPLQLDNIRVLKSGNINITGLLSAPLISGNLHVNEAVYILDTSFASSASVADLDNVVFVNEIIEDIPLEKESGFSLDIKPQFNIQATIPPVFRVMGAGLNSIWQGELMLLGSLEELLLVGTLSHADGTFELLGKEFELTRSAVVFSGNMTLPIYDITLERTNEVIDTIAKISGVGLDIDVDITSNPVLPINEILARTIYAKPLSELTQFEAIQVAATAGQLLSPTLAQFNILEVTRRNLGLDIRVNTNNASNESDNFFDGVAVEVGGYLNDSLYLGVEQGMEDTAVRLEIKLFSNINANARIGTDTSQAGILWKNDY